ncbi:cobalt-precorrin 5A hydrolase [Sulfoacidibacillus thermotolerans]|uniref:Cobalamin biosynthesis protein CbiG n=1 Tax=Sulfoacidibacillus thermotolerans TaxID=1765684 RepID=A0A2U3DBS7_SULT2|nr:cobalamin biosynthesis protein [Sulfoacidibacillus thermotolerans]PWI58730.1 cobalamin biosynthesis protein CbiG [Sulfoacidibacillus thermotolerans]
MTKRFAIVAITKHGTAIARRLQAKWTEVDVYYPQKFAQGDEANVAIQTFSEPVMQLLPTLFAQYEGIISIISLGAMVRMIAPLLKDKKSDPAVVVIDDRATYAISVLSGHLGGANELTRTVAKMLDALPVITTASDVSETIAVDLLGRVHGWKIDLWENVTKVSAAVVNEEPVLFVQESGERDWWTYEKPLPKHIRVLSKAEQILEHPFHAALIVTHRLLSQQLMDIISTSAVLYRPKVLVVGIGCNRNTSEQEIEQVILATLHERGLAWQSVRNLATIDKKADEPGLLAVCEKYHWPLVTYSAQELNTVELPHPSDTVFRYVGAYGVSEPAARLSAQASDWIVEKVKSGNVTVSVSLITHEMQEDERMNFTAST